MTSSTYLQGGGGEMSDEWKVLTKLQELFPKITLDKAYEEVQIRYTMTKLAKENADYEVQINAHEAHQAANEKLKKMLQLKTQEIKDN